MKNCRKKLCFFLDEIWKIFGRNLFLSWSVVVHWTCYNQEFGVELLIAKRLGMKAVAFASVMWWNVTWSFLEARTVYQWKQIYRSLQPRWCQNLNHFWSFKFLVFLKSFVISNCGTKCNCPEIEALRFGTNLIHFAYKLFSAVQNICQKWSLKIHLIYFWTIKRLHRS